MMSSFRQLTVGSCSRPVADTDRQPAVTAAVTAAGAGAGQSLSVDLFLSVHCFSS